MQSKTGPAAIAVAVIVVLVLCVFLYKHFFTTPVGPSSTGPDGTYKPPYASTGNAGPHANATPGGKG